MFQCCHPHGTLKTSYIYVSDNFKPINGTHILLMPDRTASWVTHLKFRWSTPIPKVLRIFYKCPATSTYRQNIAPIAFFGS